MHRRSSGVLALAMIAAPIVTSQNSMEQAKELVTKVQRADYEGDRPELKRLYLQLAALVDDEDLAPRARYWRGFAMWRRALNGFNESVEVSELLEDLLLAESEFDAIPTGRPISGEAKIGAASCLANRAAVLYTRKELGQSTELLNRSVALLREVELQDPENPRYLWVLGTNQWYAPPNRGGGQSAAIETYKKGLAAVRQNPEAIEDHLDPTWGEAELLMNLAWSNLHKSVPDVDGADAYARAAVRIVPQWHYVRDILLPQIRQRMK